MISLISPKDGASVSVMTAAQKEFVRRHRAGELHDGDDPFRIIADGDVTDASAPATAVFSWSCDDKTALMTLEISDREDFSVLSGLCVSPVRQSAEDGVYFAGVTNFLLGQKYYWRVRAGGETSATRTFTTPWDDIRVMDVDFVPNFRDLGGRMTASGRRVKQGLLYRGTFIDWRGDRCGLTWRGKNTFARELGIKTEIDLRIEALGRHKTSPAGDGIRYEFIPMENPFGGTFNERGMGELRKIFDVLFDPSAYPVYFHCHSGADRTGFLGIVLDGVLGIPDDDIRLNYNFTSLYEHRNWDECDDAKGYFGYLDEICPGRTMSEQVMFHLTEYGIDREKLEKMREFLLED